MIMHALQFALDRPLLFQLKYFDKWEKVSSPPSLAEKDYPALSK